MSKKMYLLADFIIACGVMMTIAGIICIYTTKIFEHKPAAVITSKTTTSPLPSVNDCDKSLQSAFKLKTPIWKSAYSQQAIACYMAHDLNTRR